MSRTLTRRIATLALAAAATFAGGTVSGAGDAATACRTWHRRTAVSDPRHTWNPTDPAGGQHQHTLHPTRPGDGRYPDPWNPTGPTSGPHEPAWNPTAPTAGRYPHAWNPDVGNPDGCRASSPPTP